MLRGYSFRPRGWALAAAALGCVVFVLLGNWQAHRAEEKRALGEQFQRALRFPPIVLPATPADAAGVIHKHVGARGRFLAEHTVLLDNRLRRGRAGYEVTTPLRLAGSDWHVLIERGWISALPLRSALPQVRTPQYEVEVDGIALEHLPRALEVGSPAAGRV